MSSKNGNDEGEEDRVEKAFTILKEAKALESTSDYWGAAERFVAAHTLLNVLAQEASAKIISTTTTGSGGILSSSSTTTSSPPQDVFNDEIVQIATLYSTKAHEYWNESRRCLIRAMERERDSDEERYFKSTTTSSNEIDDSSSACEDKTEKTSGGAPSGVPPPIVKPPNLASKATMHCATLDDDQATLRNETFAKLFSRFVMVTETTPSLPVEQPPSSTINGTSTTSTTTATAATTTTTASSSSSVMDQQSSIEERLHQLNKSLPTGFKTTEERMSDLNVGLNKLGLSLYTQKEPFARFRDHDTILPKSEEEQMEEIMAQVADEVGMEEEAAAAAAPNGTMAKISFAMGGDEESVGDPLSSDDDDDNDDDSELLEDDQLAIKTIRKRVVKAQVRIGELLSLLDQAKDAKDRVDQLLEEGITPQRHHKRSNKISMRQTGSDDDDDDSEAEEALNENIQKVDVAFFMGCGKRKLKSANRNLRRAIKEWEESFSL